MAELLAESGLDRRLAKNGPFTIFAPNNEAFQEFYKIIGGKEKLLSDRSDLLRVRNLTFKLVSVEIWLLKCHDFQHLKSGFQMSFRELYFYQKLYFCSKTFTNFSSLLKTWTVDAFSHCGGRGFPT